MERERIAQQTGLPSILEVMQAKTGVSTDLRDYLPRNASHNSEGNLHGNTELEFLSQTHLTRLMSKEEYMNASREIHIRLTGDPQIVSRIKTIEFPTVQMLGRGDFQPIEINEDGTKHIALISAESVKPVSPAGSYLYLALPFDIKLSELNIYTETGELVLMDDCQLEHEERLGYYRVRLPHKYMGQRLHYATKFSSVIAEREVHSHLQSLDTDKLRVFP